jgi:class 3 adenylate cyclase
MNPPATRYARSGDVNIAYQVTGEGPLDLVFVMGWVSHLDWFWKEPHFARFLQRLASFSRLILFDKRGTGLSDRVANSELPTLEQRMDDVRAVMDACGSRQAVVMGVSEGGPLCALFAATYPERTRALVIVNGYARRLRAPDYPAGMTAEEHERQRAFIRDRWGAEPMGIEQRMPSVAADPRIREWWTTYLRMSASPGAVLALSKMNAEIDIRHVLPAIAVPTLVVQTARDLVTPQPHGRYLAEHIRGARLHLLDGDDHLPWFREGDLLAELVSEFVTGTRGSFEPDRVLATVLFTDMVDSTATAARLGDRAWRELLEAHERCSRESVARFRGRWIKSTGDGILAAFDGPARAIRCALALRAAMGELGVELRAGLHTGECEVLGEDVGGIAVHTGARIAALAGGGEVLVSGTVRDLVAGSGIDFEDRGEVALKGIPGRWRILRVVALPGASPAPAAGQPTA